MKQFIIENFVNAKKLAVINSGRFEKIIIESNFSNNRINNIYRAKIVKKIPSMDAVFIDYGGENNGFLKLENLNKLGALYPNSSLNIGDNVMVQLIKEEKGVKRAKFTTDISIQGRYVVLVSNSEKILFSSKIKSSQERSRLGSIVEEIISELKVKNGFIIRTESVGLEKDRLKKDIEKVCMDYADIQRLYGQKFDSECIFSSGGDILKFIESNFDDNVEKIVCSFEDGFAEDEIFLEDIKNIIKKHGRENLTKIVKESGADVFESHGINNMLKKYKSRKIWMDKGAYIVIDKAEAMTVVDVNSGRNIGTGDYENAILNINLSAASEISEQIMVRDISGIILIDFIDMKKEENREKIIDEMNRKFGCDDRKSKIHGFTKLGLLEISRMRKNDSFENYYLKDGISDTKSDNSLIDELERLLIYTKYHLNKNILNIYSIDGAVALKECIEKFGAVGEEFQHELIFNESLLTTRSHVLDKLKEKYNMEIKVNRIV